MSTVDALGLVASAVFLVRLLPQPLRLARHGVADGVSALAAFNAVVAAVAWIAYGLWVALPVVWVVSVAALVPCIWQLVLLRHRLTSGDLAAGLALVAALVGASVLGVLGVALGGLVVVTAGPQVRQVYADHDLTGVAPATWWVALVDATTWGLYGLAVADPALLGYFAVLVTASVAVLLRLHRAPVAATT